MKYKVTRTDGVPVPEDRIESGTWARVKRNQAKEADRVAACASGIGEYGIANANYKLAGILRQQAQALEESDKR